MAWLGLLLSPLYILLATLLIYFALILIPVWALGGGRLLCWLLECIADLQHGIMSAVVAMGSAQSSPISWHWTHMLLAYATMLCLLPLFDALRYDMVRPLQLRLLTLLRRWPYLVAFLFLLTVIVLLP